MRNSLVMGLWMLCIPALGQNVGIGILVPLGKLHVKGASDISQLIIDANSTQSNSNPMIRLRKSGGCLKRTNV